MYKSYLRIFTAAIIVALGGRASSALAITDLTACGPITAPGVYRLVKNLTAQGNCFVFKANNIELDLNGHRIQGNGTGAGVFDNFDFNKRLSGIRVHDGVISNFDVGVSLPLTTQGEAFRLRVHHNRIGLSVNTVQIDESLVVKNVTGIEGTGAIIFNNVINSNQGDGVYAVSYTHLTLPTNREV